tara:strand:- start:167 stop:427 length:261 start_codon:yes stop_codon:yes gene_type:complete
MLNNIKKVNASNGIANLSSLMSAGILIVKNESVAFTTFNGGKQTRHVMNPAIKYMVIRFCRGLTLPIYARPIRIINASKKWDMITL